MAAANSSASSSHGKCPAAGWTTSRALGNRLANSATGPGGHGLVLLPSVFNWPNVGADKSPVTTASIRYPAAGVGLLWEPPPALAGLATVLGHTRTSLLAALAEPLTTAALASRLGISPSAVSQHLGALCGAGLVSTQRKGRRRVHDRWRLAGVITPAGFHRS